MALYKEIKLNNGFVLSYHRIEKVIYSLQTHRALVTILSYKDKSYRDRELLVSKTREEADRLYKELTSESINLSKASEEAYCSKLFKLADILNQDDGEPYYVQRNEVEIRDIFDVSNIKYIYDKLKHLDFYSGAKEV